MRWHHRRGGTNVGRILTPIVGYQEIRRNLLARMLGSGTATARQIAFGPALRIPEIGGTGPVDSVQLLPRIVVVDVAAEPVVDELVPSGFDAPHPAERIKGDAHVIAHSAAYHLTRLDVASSGLQSAA